MCKIHVSEPVAMVLAYLAQVAVVVLVTADLGAHTLFVAKLAVSHPLEEFNCLNYEREPPQCRASELTTNGTSVVYSVSGCSCEVVMLAEPILCNGSGVAALLEVPGPPRHPCSRGGLPHDSCLCLSAKAHNYPDRSSSSSSNDEGANSDGNAPNYHINNSGGDGGGRGGHSSTRGGSRNKGSALAQTNSNTWNNRFDDKDRKQETTVVDTTRAVAAAASGGGGGGGGGEGGGGRGGRGGVDEVNDGGAREVSPLTFAMNTTTPSQVMTTMFVARRLDGRVGLLVVGALSGGSLVLAVLVSTIACLGVWSLEGLPAGLAVTPLFELVFACFASGAYMKTLERLTGLGMAVKVRMVYSLLVDVPQVLATFYYMRLMDWGHALESGALLSLVLSLASGLRTTYMFVNRGLSEVIVGQSTGGSAFVGRGERGGTTNSSSTPLLRQVGTGSY